MKLLFKRRKLNSATASPADTAGLASFVGPAAVENMPRHLKIGDGYAATLIVTGYPAEVGGAWLDPLLAWPRAIRSASSAASSAAASVIGSASRPFSASPRRLDSSRARCLRSLAAATAAGRGSM